MRLRTRSQPRVSIAGKASRPVGSRDDLVLPRTQYLVAGGIENEAGAQDPGQILAQFEFTASSKDQIAHAKMATEILTAAIGQGYIEPENDVFGRCVIATQVNLVQMPII